MWKYRITKYLTSGFWICLVWMLMCIRLGMADPILDTVIEGIKFNDSLLKDVSAKYRLVEKLAPEFFSGPTVRERADGTTEVRALGTRRLVMSDWVVKGDKIRIQYTMSSTDETQGNYEVLQEKTIIFDGNKSAILEKGHPSWRGMIKMGNQIQGIKTPLYFGYYCRGKLLSEILPNNKVVLQGKEQIFNIECYVIEVISQEGWRSVMWIDPSSGFRVRKLENYGNDGLLIVRLDSMTFKKYGEVWFPSSGKLYTNPRKRADGTQTLTVETELIIDEVQINRGLPDSLFEMMWPSGTTIYDYIIGEGYSIP